MYNPMQLVDMTTLCMSNRNGVFDGSVHLKKIYLLKYCASTIYYTFHTTIHLCDSCNCYLLYRIRFYI